MLNEVGAKIGSDAIAAAITHIQLHTAAPTAGVGSELGGRVASVETVDADGDIIWNTSFTGLTANATVWGASYWSAATAGVTYGQLQRTTGDVTVNAAGEYTWTGAENTTLS